MLSPGLQAAVAGLQPRAHTSPLPPTPCSVHVGRATRSTHRLVCRSHDDGKKSPKANKADFSAYWSFQVQQWFSSRRQYLEGDPSQKGKETAFDKKLDEQIEKSEAELKTIRAQERRELAEAISTQYAPQLKAGVPVEQLPIPEVLAARDIVAGKAYLDSFRVKGLAIGLQRAERLLRSILMLPATVTVAAANASGTGATVWAMSAGSGRCLHGTGSSSPSCARWPMSTWCLTTSSGRQHGVLAHCLFWPIQEVLVGRDVAGVSPVPVDVMKENIGCSLAGQDGQQPQYHGQHSSMHSIGRNGTCRSRDRLIPRSNGKKHKPWCTRTELTVR
ncbi:uncharacterized protein HaLaN_20924, partial [Haematococcus lacustris]